MKEDKVTILASGVALGVYIPALLVNYQLRRRGVAAEVVVLENLLLPEKKAKIPANKQAFHRSFRVALAGQKMAVDLWPHYDKKALAGLFDAWQGEGRRNFIVFSGFWMSVLREYINTVPGNGMNVEIVHMDADISASWRLFRRETTGFNNVWLFDGRNKKVDYELRIAQHPPVPYRSRPDRYVIHGGGWGMGNYREKIAELEEGGLKLDIVAYEAEETENLKAGHRSFMIDPCWSPWIKNNNDEHEFPPFGQITGGRAPVFKNKQEYHDLFDVIRLSRAIISKPGGATLADSLASATPLVILESFGNYEQQNAELWEHLGFGIRYDDWKTAGFSGGILEKFHYNLLSAAGLAVDYVSDYIDRNCGRAPGVLGPGRSLHGVN